MIPIRDTVPVRRVPWVTWTLIAINVAVFGYQMMLPERELELFVKLYGILPANYTNMRLARVLDSFRSPLLPLFTSMFLHGGLLHLIGNMLSLWIFGDNVEDKLGPLKYVAFYLLAGLFAGLVHVLTNLESIVPTVGASGAIAGVMGAYFLLFPRAKVVMLVPLFFLPLFFTVPAVVFLFFWFASQLFQGVLSLGMERVSAGIAWWAHVGGFLGGMLLVRLFGARRQPRNLKWERPPRRGW